MKEIDISTPKYPNKFTIVDDEDFEKLNQFKWCYSSQGYATRNISKHREHIAHLKIHRVIMGAKKGEIVDHINRNPLDNRKQNLRICTYAENLRNSQKQHNNTSGYIGVHKKFKNREKCWYAQIGYNTKKIYIGVFKTKEEAAIAYNKKAKELFGDFAVLNNL